MTDSSTWEKLYPAGISSSFEVVDHDLVAAWHSRVSDDPGAAAVTYFDTTMSAREIDTAADAFAVALSELGVARGDRVGIYLQNLPAYPVALIAVWKLGAVALILNPMYKGRELRELIDDAQAAGLIHADHDGPDLDAALRGSTVNWRISTSVLDRQSRDDRRLADTGQHQTAPNGDVWQLIDHHNGEQPPPIELASDDVALLTYTSGTTGPPKGAMNTHTNILNVARSLQAWIDLGRSDVVLAMAPFFHITGAVVNAIIAMLAGSNLVLIGRFHPELALEAFAEHEVTYTVGSITAYNAMMQVPWAEREHFASARLLYSGGAPIPPSTVEQFEARFGHYIHNAYGMTETTSGVIAVPPGVRAPVDESSGSLSIGVPLPNLDVLILDDAGARLPAGDEGELEMSGPQIVPGYWHKPEETKQTLPDGRLHSGDAAIMDQDGWVYLVDRLKDQVNVSGFKVWPREVEDVLYEHPAVVEAAVVGQPDEYQGEAVAAYVSIKPGHQAGPDDLIAFVRDRLAAYKAPKTIHIIDDLPKTPTGKIRRNVLRDE